MRKAQLQKFIENELIGIGYDIGFNILDRLEDDEDIDTSEFDDMLNEELDSWFTYYEDAWEYLQDNNITDFSDAIHEWGATDICAIAMYYAREEIWDCVNRYWDDYEYEEDPEDYEVEEDE